MKQSHRCTSATSRLLPTLSLLAAVFASCSVEITASRYALVYGAADYPTANDLSYTGNDAVSMEQALSDAGWVVRTVRQPTVDKQDILGDISDLVLEPLVNADSSVLIYFSGHGTADVSGNTYIVPTDEELISSEELLSALSVLPCRNRVVILDTCHSGGFIAANDTGTVDAAPQNFGVFDDGTEKSVLLAALGAYSRLLGAAFQSYNPYAPIFVTAAGAEELSYESSTFGHGVFTYYFLESASNGDADGNGFVTIQEAYQYARTMVDYNWNNIYYLYQPTWTDPDTGITYYYPYADYLPRISGNARDIVIF